AIGLRIATCLRGFTPYPGLLPGRRAIPNHSHSGPTGSALFLNWDRKEDMRRFELNRWWAFILVLCLGVTTTVALASFARADYTRQADDGGDPRSGSGGPPVYGDPDLPGGY